jgi:GNAT superfamily N-acetyltransferase
MPEPQVDRMPVESMHAAIAATSRAFWPDPLFGFFARNEVHEHRVLPIFLGAMMRDAQRHGQVWTAGDDTQVIGSASWLPPGSLPRSRTRELRIYAACTRALITGRNRRTGIRLLDLVEKSHPVEPHWYLAVLGVDPRHQGRGLGRALIQPVLDRCDREIVPAYLETQKPENLPFYERFGFRVTDEISVPGSPPVWLMWRDPDPTRLDR